MINYGTEWDFAHWPLTLKKYKILSKRPILIYEKRQTNLKHNIDKHTYRNPYYKLRNDKIILFEYGLYLLKIFEIILTDEINFSK